MPEYKFQEITVQDAGGDVIAHGINDRGQITGSYITNIPFDPYPNAFIDDDGTVTTIPLTNPGQHDAYGINNLGQVSGTMGDAPVGVRGFLWSMDNSVQTIANQSGGVSGLIDQARGVNDFGQVVGTDYIGHHEGFVWQAGRMSFLQYPGASFTDATGISDTGVIVGFYSAGTQPNGSPTPNHAFVDVRRHMTTIAVPGAASAEANGISPGGLEVVGT